MRSSLDQEIRNAYAAGRQEARFWSRIEKQADGCWQWTGTLSADGYGRMGAISIHRYAYELIVGPIPKGLELDHLCRNRPCCNPAHLEPVTRFENNRRTTGSRSKPAA